MDLQALIDNNYPGPSLHFYKAMIWNKWTLWGNYHMTVGNGIQTKDVESSLLNNLENPIEALTEAHQNWTYEDDPPVFTPRISGCVSSLSGRISDCKAAIGIIKQAADGSAVRHQFEIPLIPGRGKLITAYNTHYEKNPPAFEGEPLDVRLASIPADKMAREIYDRLHNGRRSAIAVLYYNTKTHEKTIKTINRYAFQNE
ncbi:MAG: hypothetical protein NTY99_02365 [DPANN group archaeon]|nr:hypothetical protein [DPANN group archaeon]